LLVAAGVAAGLALDSVWVAAFRAVAAGRALAVVAVAPAVRADQVAVAREDPEVDPAHR
jgi:hypothetical protein